MMKGEISAYVCDDSKVFADKVERALEYFLRDKRAYKITSFYSGEELIKRWEEEFADVIFLDIDMPEMNGFEAARKMQETKKDAVIVFITSHEDKVYQSYEYQPFWFVRKTHFNEMNVVLPRVLTKIDTEYEKNNGKYTLNTEKCIIEIDVNEVVSLESYKHDLIINYKNNETKKYRCRISDAEKQLLPMHIVRVQNGILINCRFISKITSREVILIDGKRINLSRKRLESVRSEFQDYLRNI